MKRLRRHHDPVGTNRLPIPSPFETGLMLLRHRLAVEVHERNLAAIQRVAGASFGAPSEVWQITPALLAQQAERPDPARSERSSTSNECDSLSWSEPA